MSKNNKTMARLINVIHKPHLATFKGYDDSKYRCCATCEYQAVIEDDKGELYVVSLLNEDDINELNLEEAIRKVSDETQKEDWFYRFDRGVGEEDIDNFVNGEIESWDDKAISAFCNVLASLRNSHCFITTDGMDALRKLKRELDKTIKSQEQ